MLATLIGIFQSDTPMNVASILEDHITVASITESYLPAVYRSHQKRHCQLEFWKIEGYPARAPLRR
jgi:hypothetical protein